MDCPKCIGRLGRKEVEISKAPDRERDKKAEKGAGTSFLLEVDQCFVCGGVWFDKGELDKYTTERLTLIDSPTVGKGLDKELDAKEGKCPRCSVVLTKHPYAKEKNITLDVCEQCGGVWLDSTEIDHIEKAYKNTAGFLASFLKSFKRGK